jgi:hypothetical protein
VKTDFNDPLDQQSSKLFLGEEVINPSTYDELEFLDDLNFNGGIDSVELEANDVESDRLLFTLNKITVNSVFASVGAAVSLFTSLVTLY